MIDKKDPRQDPAKADAADNDIIIDLTDEVTIESEDDEGIILDNEQEMIDESLIGTTDEDTLDAEGDEDVIIVNNAQLDEDEDDVAIIDGGYADTQEEEDIFDLEKEIEIEYEADEDEDELIALDDERSEDQPDFVNIVLGESAESDRRDQTEEPTEYLEFSSDQPSDILDLKKGVDENQSDAEAADAEALENGDIEDLPDLAAISELEFEDDDEADSATNMIAKEPDSSDDIVARTMEQTLESGDDSERLKPPAGTQFGSEDDDDLIALDGDRQEAEEMVALEHDEELDFEENEDLLVDLEGLAELEDEDEILPLDDSEDFGAEKEDDIVEITEFDQHYATESDNMLEQAGILDSSNEDEEDFLELIEVDEDRQTEDEETTGVDESDEKTEYVELDNFFSDASEEEGLEHEAGGLALSNDSADELGLDEEEAPDAEESQTPELVAKTDASDLEDEAFDFNFDPGMIAQQVDRLDAFLSDEPEVASLTADDSPQEGDIPPDLSADRKSEELSALTTGQIDAAIERVINEKFAGKIENIICEVIEKAVAKEIDRLKSVLMDSARPDDNY
jgi:hypothetical protein